jgi:hypothetical protein
MTEVKQPQDHQQAAQPYVHTFEDGRTATFKPFAKLPVGAFRKARLEADEMAQTFMLLEAATDEDGLAVIDEQPIDALNDVFERWAAASGVDAPESSGSSDSSTSTEELSSTTGAPVSA